MIIEDRTYSYEKINESLVAKNWSRKYFNFNFSKKLIKVINENIDANHICEIKFNFKLTIN